MEIGQQKLNVTLQAAGYSATKTRKAVFDKLVGSDPMSVSVLANKLHGEVDKATVYRTAELFEKLGIVNRTWHGFKNHIELSEIFTPHHHHAVCQNCLETIQISSPELEAALNTLAKAHNFLAVNHSVELIGYCQKCQ